MNNKNNNHMQNCWTHIGIYGDSSCEKLEDYVHCRNCPVYYEAARSLFDRDIPIGYLEEWAKVYAGSEETEPPGTFFAVVFRLKDEWLALRTVHLQEVTKNRPVHYVPFRSSNVFLGLVNINGELVPCVSAADILGLTGDTEEQSNESRMIVIKRDKERFVFPVDEMLGLRRLSPEDKQKTPATLSKSSTALSTGVFSLDEKTVGFLDEDKFFESLKRSLVF